MKLSEYILTEKNNNLKKRIIFHIDVNNAFLSWTAVHMLINGADVDIRNIPSVIGGDEENRHGIVLAKSPVAKQFGIKTGEPLYFARKKCPNIKVYKGNFKVYKEYSNAMIEIFKQYTDKIEQYSIDECSLDLTQFLLPEENIYEKAKRISTEIKEKLGFTVNIGIANNKVLAKMASDFEKPDKIHTLYDEEIKNKMWPLPISDLYMVGKRSILKFEKMGIKTIGDLANYDVNRLIKKFGKYGKMVWEYANGIDNSPVKVNEDKPKGIGNSITLPSDISNIEKLNEILLNLVEQVAYRLRKQKMLAYVVDVQIKTNEFKVYSHQKKMSFPTDTTVQIYNEAKILLNELYNKSNNKLIRLIGIRVDHLIEPENSQITLFDIIEDNKTTIKQKKLDKMIDSLKDKYGYNIVTRAVSIKSDINTDKNKI